MKKFISFAKLTRYDIKLKAYISDLMTAANGDISAVQALVNTLIGTDSAKSARTIAAEEIAKQLIPENAAEALDTLQEIAAWIQAHPGDVAEINRRITALENYVGKPATGVKGEEGYTAATGLFLAVENAQAAAEAHADQVVGAEKTRAELAESSLDERIGDLEDKFTGEGSVESQIATAKQEAIDAAAEDATTKVDDLKNTAVSSTSGEDVIVTLGGTVGAPTVNVQIEFATDDDIDSLFAPKSEESQNPEAGE